MFALFQELKLLVSQEISNHKWTWIDHTITKQNFIEKEALDWNPETEGKE